MGDVLCFGNLQCDVLCRTIKTWPAPGELYLIDEIDTVLSGNGGNVAAALARLGLSVELAGYSGADLTGERLRGTLAALGVKLTRLLQHPSAPSGVSCVAVGPSGERSIVCANGANALFDLDSVEDTWFLGVDVVSVGAVFVLPQFTGTAISRLFARAHEHGATTVLNVAWDAGGRGLSSLQPALEFVDYLVLNHDEGRQLTGLAVPKEIVKALETQVRGAVILTLGADGCLLRDENQMLQRIPAVIVEALDCTGAGDAFVAGFIAGLHEGRSAFSCATLGCNVASYAVTGTGAYARIPQLHSIDEGGTTDFAMPATRPIFGTDDGAVDCYGNQ